jgi:hypothetical protein
MYVYVVYRGYVKSIGLAGLLLIVYIHYVCMYYYIMYVCMYVCIITLCMYVCIITLCMYVYYCIHTQLCM